MSKIAGVQITQQDLEQIKFAQLVLVSLKKKFLLFEEQSVITRVADTQIKNQHVADHFGMKLVQNWDTI